MLLQLSYYLSGCSSITQIPVFLFPSWRMMPSFCKADKSRSTVLTLTFKDTAIDSAVEYGLSLMIAHIFH